MADRRSAQPILKGWVGAVVKNPYAGRYVADITPMMEALKPIGLLCTHRLVAALGGDPGRIEAYGKGAIVGASGEIEHSALWHVPGGYAMREVLGKALAIVPSAVKTRGDGGSDRPADPPQGRVLCALAFRCNDGGHRQMRLARTRSPFS